MKILRTAALIAEKTIFGLTDPIVKPARALGMFDSKRIGATAIEYGLIAAGISVAIIAVVHGLRHQVVRHPSVTTPPKRKPGGNLSSTPSSGRPFCF
jgi:hypothetical protein